MLLKIRRGDFFSIIDGRATRFNNCKDNHDKKHKQMHTNIASKLSKIQPRHPHIKPVKNLKTRGKCRSFVWIFLIISQMKMYQDITKKLKNTFNIIQK